MGKAKRFAQANRPVSGFLIDTNVVSEFVKPEPNRGLALHQAEEGVGAMAGIRHAWLVPGQSPAGHRGNLRFMGANYD